MIVEFAPAKINLALHVLGRRADGYHELDSIVAFADIGDRLEVTPAADFVITATGPFAGDMPESQGNIVHGAWLLACDIASARGRAVPNVQVRIDKVLPVAAGIGGGSSDAAATLRACLSLAGLAVDEEISAAALALGADVPVCLGAVACRMRGVGERLERLPGFAALDAVLVNPGALVPTKEVFQRIGLTAGTAYKSAIPDRHDLLALRNDMTDAAVAIAPVIGAVLAALAGHGDVACARMSGSGATCFGLLRPGADAAAIAAKLKVAHPTWWVRAARIG